MELTAPRVKLFADVNSIQEIEDALVDSRIAGFTTNPTLLRSAGINSYADFAREALATSSPRSVSIEVLSDDIVDISRQARILAALGHNSIVKIPITSSTGQSHTPLIGQLVSEGINVNVTAIMTSLQIEEVSKVMGDNPRNILSVFMGRIADTGRDPLVVAKDFSRIVKQSCNSQLLWASTREILNIVHAEQVGFDIITVTPNILKKLDLWGKDLHQYSVETSKMFVDDGVSAGFNL